MAMFYSKSTKGFYTDAVHTPQQIPSDAVNVDDAAYQALLAAQASGKVIVGDEHGAPVARDYVPTSADYVFAAKSALDESDKTILRCAENGIAVPPAWATYRAALRSVVSGSGATSLPARPAYPSGT